MNEPQPIPTAPESSAANGRDANGRFARGNPGGPGNPYYRRQAELKRKILESVTDVDVMSVMRVLLGLARTGDLAAIKLFLEYTVSKPNATVDPDKADLHEWGLKRQAPKLEEVIGQMGEVIPTPTANAVVDRVQPIAADCNLKRLSQTIRSGIDFDGHRIAPPLEETTPANTNGGKRPKASARRMAAGVRAADPTGDNGADEERAWNEMLDEEFRDDGPTGDIGTIAAALRTLPDGGKEVIDRLGRSPD
jgi:hypothetical protein